MGVWAFEAGGRVRDATLALIVEYWLGRRAEPFVWRSFLRARNNIVVVIAAVGLGFGPSLSGLVKESARRCDNLLLAALREHGEARVGLAVLAAIALSLCSGRCCLQMNVGEESAVQRAAHPQLPACPH